MTSPHEQKLKITGPVVVTANRLGDGAVVYRTAEGGWSTELAAAAVVSNSADARDLLVGASQTDIDAVGPYVAPVRFERDIGVLPGNLREEIRRNGPTFALPGQAAA
jgi:hypothetical protein